MIKAIIGFDLQPGKSMAAYKRNFSNWRAPAILGNRVAPCGLSLMYAVKQAVPPGHPAPTPMAYQGLTLNWFESSEQLAAYADTPLFDTLAKHGLEWLSGTHGYMVDEVVHWQAPQTTQPGKPAQGFKMIVRASRKAGVSKADFEKHYREVHAPLARKHHPAMIGYVQNFVRMPLMTESPDIDVITEMHFHDRADFKKHFYLNEKSAAITSADIALFMDLDSVQCLTVEEVIYKTPA
ncbi:MAG TPA: EthD domain-containing protein [Pseudomonadales bacterium]|jgi:uncharacterized protein (TIGR02118 family)